MLPPRIPTDRETKVLGTNSNQTEISIWIAGILVRNNWFAPCQMVSSQRRAARSDVCVEKSLVIVILCHVCGRTLFLIYYSGVKLIFNDWHLTRFDVTRNLIFDDVCSAILQKLRRCDHWVFEFKSLPLPINRYTKQDTEIRCPEEKSLKKFLFNDTKFAPDKIFWLNADG